MQQSFVTPIVVTEGVQVIYLDEGEKDEPDTFEKLPARKGNGGFKKVDASFRRLRKQRIAEKYGDYSNKGE